jgi:hypothetical protein
MTATARNPKINLDLINYKALRDVKEYLPGCTAEQIMNEALEFYVRASAAKDLNGIYGKTDDDIEKAHQATARAVKRKAQRSR